MFLSEHVFNEDIQMTNSCAQNHPSSITFREIQLKKQPGIPLYQ